MKETDFDILICKVMSMRRAGYSVKGSRARKNETIEINRTALIEILRKTSYMETIYKRYLERHQRAVRFQFSREMRLKFGWERTPAVELRKATKKKSAIAE